MSFVIREVDCQAVTFKRLCGLPFSVLNLQVRFVFVYRELIVWNTEWERSHNLYTCPEKKKWERFRCVPSRSVNQRIVTTRGGNIITVSCTLFNVYTITGYFERLSLPRSMGKIWCDVLFWPFTNWKQRMLSLDRFKNRNCSNTHLDKPVRLKVAVSFTSLCYLNWDELVRNTKSRVCFTSVWNS